MPEGRAAPGDRASRLDWQLAIVVLLTAGLLVPIVVVPGTFFPYVVPRNVLFRVVVELSTVVLISRVVLGGKRLDLRGEHVLALLGAFLAALTVSAIFSPARSHSLFGDFERMGGVWAWLHLALFFLVLRALEARYLLWLLRAAVAVSFLASAHAIVERFADPARGTTGGLSLIGNPGLFAGYLLLAIPIALYLWGSNGRYRWLYMGAAAVDCVALVLTQNRSSIVGLVGGALVGTLLFAFVGDRASRRWVPFALAVGIALVLSGLVAAARTVRDGSGEDGIPDVVNRLAVTDFAGGDASRTLQWDAALSGFRDRPALGYGPENHHLAWSAHFDPRAYELGADVFDRTHNAFLEALATTGIVGMAAFLAIWLTIAYSLYRAFKAGRLRVWELSLLAGANVAYAIYLVFWFLDINAMMLWLVMAAVVATRCNPAGIVRDGARATTPARGMSAVSMLVTGLALGFILQRHAYAPLRTSVALATLDSYDGDQDRAFDAVRVVSASSAPQTSHLGQVLGEFIASLKKRGELEAADRDPVRRQHINRTFAAAIAAFDAELRRDPLNDRLHTAAAGTLIEASRFYDSRPHLDRAISLLNRAIELSPRRAEQKRLLEMAKRCGPPVDGCPRDGF